MKKVIITAIEEYAGNHGLSSNIHHIALNVQDDMSTDDIKDAMSKAATDYCKTPEGKQVYQENCNCFNIGDFDTHVPNDICKKYGIEKIDSDTSFGTIDFNTELVDEFELND